MKRKVIFIASYANSLINFRLQLMTKFLNNGFKVIALAPYDQEVEIELNKLSITFRSIPLQRNGLNPLSDIKLLLKLYDIFKKEKPDIIFSYTIKPVIYGSIAAKIAKVNNIYALITGTGYAFLNHSLKTKVIGYLARNLLKQALNQNTKVFFQNPDNLDFFLQNRLISKNKPHAVVNGSGVDCNHFFPIAHPDQISFLMIARLLNCKGVREYVAAAKRLKKIYPHIQFFLAGWIDSNPESIKQHELDSWIENKEIEFLGKLSDIRACMALASVYVLPSWNEGMPRTVLEAMAMARPIITTDAPGCKETVIPYTNGLLVPVKNIDKLCQAMEYFIQFSEKVPVMGEASRRIALDKYDIDKVNNCMFEEMGLR